MAVVRLGRLVRAVGLRGELKLRPTADFWEAALSSERLELELAGERRAVVVEAQRRQGTEAWVLRFREIADRSTAEAAIGADLVLDGFSDVEPPEGLRPFQVRGLRVVLADGTVVGTIADLVPMPAHDVLVVRDGEREHWIPAVHPILRAVDLDSGEVRIDPPPGLLEL